MVLSEVFEPYSMLFLIKLNGQGENPIKVQQPSPLVPSPSTEDQLLAL